MIGRSSSPRAPRAYRRGLPWVSAWMLTLCLVPAMARAGDSTPVSARSELTLAEEAARAWAPDAALVYLENDEAVDPTGRAPRWGYLFHSPSLDAARAYSVQSGEIVEAVDLDFRFDPPPVPSDWMDSDAALRAADEAAGLKFAEENALASVTTLLLMRGAFQDRKPDLTTWTVVYTAAGAPSLFVVVDARTGKVTRMWRG